MRSIESPMILDLFCGGGGAAEGYLRTFPNAKLVGVDIRDHSTNYPAEFVQGDAIEYLKAHGKKYDLVHASPPCQGYSKHVTSASSRWVPTKGKDEPKLIAPLRSILARYNRSYVIENVMGAKEHLIDPVILCGTMFGLPISRHRLFETSFDVVVPPHPKCIGVAKDYAEERGWEYRDMSVTGKGRRTGTADRWSEILGIKHRMTQAELSEAIPPAYTEYISQQWWNNGH